MRFTRKMVSEMAEDFGYSLVTHQQLGNAKNYWYTYSIVRKKDNEVICSSRPLRDCFYKLVDHVELDCGI